MGIKSKRVAFTFDERSLKTLEQIQAEGVDLTQTCPCCGQPRPSRGPAQVTLRNSDGTERVVAIPPLPNFL